MGALPPALEIIFEVQRKSSIFKTNKKKNKLFNLQNMFFFKKNSLWTLPTFKCPKFLIHFQQFKVL